MSIKWSDLAAAFALMLVLEGILPFVSPDRLRRMLRAVEQMGDQQLRFAAITSMLLGLVLLYVVKR
ncbi:MAG: DUF2065 domain-containing protein [Acidiferrobacterales bacterium]